MAYKINPAFDRFPEEATLVGRILSSFGEIELTVCQCAHTAVQLPNHTILKALYRLRTTSSRIDVADELMAPIYAEHQLEGIYGDAMGPLRYCVKIRNQYAHCNWADHETAGLFFADLETSATNKDFNHIYKHIDPVLLQKQYEFFGFTLECWRYADNQLAQKTRKSVGLYWPKPVGSTRPPLHNLASAHVPPWLTPEQQAAHLRRSQEAEQSAPLSQRPPSVPRLTEEQWIAKYRKDGKPFPDAEAQ